MVEFEPKDPAHKDEAEPNEADDPDQPTMVGHVSERLLKALKHRGMPDAQVLESPKPQGDTPTQPPPPPDAAPPEATEAQADDDESATNVLLTPRAPFVVKRSPEVSDEDQSETLYAITASTGRKPSAAPVEPVPAPPPEPAPEPLESGPLTSPLAPVRRPMRTVAAGALVAAIVVAAVVYALVAH